MTVTKILPVGAAVVGLLLGHASAAIEAEGFTFEDNAFADAVADYQVGDPSPNTEFQDATKALGPFFDPDGEIRGVALGVGGVLTVRFVDNRLIGDGTAASDLVIFEGGSLEAFFVSVSVDGFTFYDLARAPGGTSEFDVDALIFAQQLDPATRFAFVRMRDDPDQGRTTPGRTVGADINAVGALNSAAVPVPAAAWLFSTAVVAVAARRRPQK